MRRLTITLGLSALLVGCVSTESPAASNGPTPSATATASPSPALPAGWILFSSVPGRFGLAFPGQPTATTQTANTAAGPVEVHLFIHQTSDLAYEASYNDYPAAMVESKDPQAVLDGALSGAVSSAKATLQSSKAITLGSVPGREWVGAVQGGTIHERLYFAGTRLYQVLAIGKGTDIPNLEAFLDSFEIRAQQ